ncbi:MAG: DUF4838 domain-containing protein, partial [Planctomycetes bacterium]|nr:DUF4838 domain-containing protein [Planctomycetota bacterium]
MKQIPLLIHVALLLAPLVVLQAADLQLAIGGTTTYQIVKPANPSGVDDYAVQTLVQYLKQITGAEFPVVEPDKMAEDRHSIFIGLSAPAIKHLGQDPLAGLKDQEHVARSIGQDIFLYGKGVHGNLHAVMEFLENSLGWRWYSVYENPVIPKKPTVTLAPFNRRRGFSFAFREVGLRYGLDFYYQNGMNMGFDRQARKLRKYNADIRDGIVSLMPNPVFVHSLHRYIPPEPDNKYARTFDWLKRKNYFETNPEFFSMSRTGQRVKNRQLCFSNPELRKELTRNILKHISLTGENCIITLDAADTPDRFCYCPGCEALEKKYGGPGGPMYDYLIELCHLLKKEHPGIMVKTLAYRRSQTQKPPVLPAGERLPENLIISFAPIEDSYFADWTHPDPRIQETYSDLVAWSKITTHLWAWLYPNPWGSGAVMPVGNVERVIINMRLMHKAGVTGVFTDHNGFLERAGWSELQSYLLYKLMQDVNCDTDAIIKEFTDHQYGAAGPLVRTYLAELEQGRKAMTVLPPGTTYRSSDYDERTFPYLTDANIHRWQTLFDRMEEQVADQAEHLLNVRLLRRELDFATLRKWFDLKKRYPEYFKDYTLYAERITAVNKSKAPAGMKPRPLGKDTLGDFLAVIQGGGLEKPLPPAFDGIDRSRIRTFVPTNNGRQAGRKRVVDPDAAFGYAATVHKPDMPFQLGFYQWKTRHPPSGKHGPRLSLSRDDIIPGTYQLHKLGTLTVTPDCLIWFSAKSWATNIDLGKRLYEPGADNLWEAYVSLKFDGPMYGGKGPENQVLVDRII